ncbi:MAG: PKD domain-containing protein [Planctomycetota bacterium]|nr:PKD domain-containing protein [Planctomycetota bacterium]
MRPSHSPWEGIVIIACQTYASPDFVTTVSTSNAFTVNPGPLDHFLVELAGGGAIPAQTAGTAFNIRMTAQDALANTVTLFTSTVQISSSGTLTSAPVTSDPFTSGVLASQGVTITSAQSGTTLTATDTVSGKSGVSNAFTVNPGAPSVLVFVVEPSDTQVAASIFPAVEVAVQDGFGNTVTAATNSIAIATASGSGTLAGTTTRSAINGVAIFGDLSIDTVGAYTLAASATGLTGATSNPFNTTAATQNHLVFSVQPSATDAGAPIAPAIQVSVKNSSGATVPGASDSITIAIGNNPGGGTLSGLVPVSAVNGVATFSDLSIDKAGLGYTLTATGSALSGATSTTFTIIGPPAKLVFQTQPVNTAGGSTIAPSPQVAIQDSLGTVVTTATNSVSIAIGANPGSGTLSGTTGVNAVKGVATFGDLSINKAGVGYTLIATSGVLSAADSGAFDIVVGAAAQLAFTVQPGTSEVGRTISPAPQVAIQDAGGNTVGTATNNITVSIGNNAGGGTLSGTTTVAAVNGVATFGSLSVDKVGTGYTLTSAATGLSGATSATFNVVDTSPPTVTSGLTPGTTEGVVDEPVTFTYGVSDAQPVTYTWEWGDGTTTTTTEGSATHPFTAPGIYLVKVTAKDPGGLSTTSTLNYTVVAGATPPVNNDICAGLSTVPLRVQQVAAKLRFPSSLSKDALTLKALLALNDGFNPDGQVVQWDIGGIRGETTLNAKGSSPLSTSVKVSLKYKKPARGQPFTARTGKLAISIKSVALDKLVLAGIAALNSTSASTKGDPATIQACVVLKGHQAYHTTGYAGVYKAKKDKGGAFKAQFKIF